MLSNTAAAAATTEEATVSARAPSGVKPSRRSRSSSHSSEPMARRCGRAAGLGLSTLFPVTRHADGGGMELDEVRRQLDVLLETRLGVCTLRPMDQARYEQLARRESELLGLSPRPPTPRVETRMGSAVMA